MDAPAKFKLEILSRVLNELSCPGGPHGPGWRWKNPNGQRPGHLAYFSYVPDRGCPWILHDEIVTCALRPELDPDEVLMRVKRGGGEILDP